MVVRIILALFVSGASIICYLAGFIRLMSGLLLGFGSLACVFFAILFAVPESSRELWVPVYGEGHSWPFFLLAFLLFCAAIATVVSKKVRGASEPFSVKHLTSLVFGFFAYLLNVFLASFFWFPSDERRLQADDAEMGMYVLAGTILYICGTMAALTLLYRASKGSSLHYPDLMRRIVLALFSVVHFDKFPALAAFLLIYSPETGVIYPACAALALSAYLPIAYFLYTISRQAERAGHQG